jgi:hypothetical protein
MMKQKGLLFLTLFALIFPQISYSFDSKSLAETRYWQKLLHARDGKSEIDSPNFFLSPIGKEDPKAELEATVQAIKYDDSVFCRFPARVKWLYQKIPSLSEEVPYQPCLELETLIADYQATKAVLVFPTAHINSPASMFGHTFLRLDDNSGRALTANAINYAAETQETSGFLFAYHGLFGGYDGRYSVLPYYKKIKEYNHLERRDIWEYTLNLNEEELTRLLTHLYELREVSADYFFATENCSYNLLWLLDVAREGSDLTSRFNFKAIPVDTIREVSDAGFIAEANFRPSKSKEIKALVDAEKLATGALKQAYQAEIEVDVLQFQRSRNEIDKDDYIKLLMEKLTARSKLPTLPDLSIEIPADPLTSHKTTRFRVGLNSDEELELGIKPAFHDIYDLETGYVSGAYIDFFDLNIVHKKNKGFEVKEFNFLNINSYAIRDEVVSPISWGISLGADQFRGKLNAKLNGEVGVTYGLHKGAFAFAVLKPAIYYSNNWVVGLGPKVGLIADFVKIKFGVNAEKLYFNQGEDNIKAELFSTFSVSENSAIHLKANVETQKQGREYNQFGLSWFFYM